MIVLSKEQIIKLYEELVSETGGTSGIRDEGLLESAINAPLQSYDNIELFPSIQQKGARLGYGIIMNHPFVDGNKRTGAHAMLVFLAINGIELCFDDDELVNTVLNVAAGKTKFEELLKWVIEHQSS